jgi:hypothetical protein
MWMNTVTTAVYTVCTMYSYLYNSNTRDSVYRYMIKYLNFLYHHLALL